MYAVQTQVESFGLNYDDAVIELAPREGEYTLRTEDILQAIQTAGDSLALSFFSGVQYYTGQLFNMPAITEAAHKVGALAGFDLAHTAGNIDLQLHNWDVDFAAWCSYKYLNSGPGSVGGVYVHERHATNRELFRLAGWWGHNKETRFQMGPDFDPIPTAESWSMSNAPVFNMIAHEVSLSIFSEVGMNALREKSLQLTAYLDFVLNEVMQVTGQKLMRITPGDPAQRGCQLSVIVDGYDRKLVSKLYEQGVVVDWREPNVIRLAPVPLYNSFEDVYRLGKVLEQIFTR
jgi:kynureninase